MKRKNKISNPDGVEEILWMQKLRTLRLQIFKMREISVLKKFVSESLPGLCNLKNISIEKKECEQKKVRNQYRQPLFEDRWMVFEKTEKFTPLEKRFLKKITQTIQSALEKMDRHSGLQALKRQWKSAFDAIRRPICLTDKDFNILSSNQAFLIEVNLKKVDIFRKNCFETFFQSPLSEEEIKILPKKRLLKTLGTTGRIYEIQHQSFSTEDGDSIHFFLFTNRTEKLEMEKKIESMREAAEMGVITSSIAHDLTNPLAGIQMLIDLTRNETKDRSVLEQTEKMKEAVHNCQHIVKQLLKSNSIQDILEFSVVEKDKSLDPAL